jgi:hypothetical protein
MSNKLPEVKEWLKDLNREINVNTSHPHAPALEIEDDDGGLRIEIGEYIVRHANTLDVDSQPREQFHGIEDMLDALDLSPIRRERDIILVQLANLKLVEIQILRANSFSAREVTRGKYSQPESEIGIENLSHYLQLIESSRDRQLNSDRL